MARKRKRKPRVLPLSRPATPQDIIDRARQYGPASIEALADEMSNNTGSARISAANSLLERGFGKVGQPLAITGVGGGPVVFRWAKDGDVHE